MIRISKQKIFFIGLVVILLLGLSVVSAQDNQAVGKSVKIEKTVKNPANNMAKVNSKNKMVVTKDVTKKKVNNTKNNIKADTQTKQNSNKTNTTKNKEAKQITKNTIKNTKQATATATDYTSLKTILTTSTDEELTVTLNGDTFTSNGYITVANAIKKLTIDGNGKTINGDSKAFLKVTNLDLTIKNITITGCSNYDGSVLYQTGGETTIVNSTIKQNTLTSDDSSLGIIKVASGTLTLDNNTFDSNSVSTISGRHGFLIHTTQTSKIVNNIFIDNDCNDEPNGYAGLINRLVDEIHDNEYYDNYLSNYIDVSFLDHNDQVVIGENADFERDIQVKLSKNVYNDTVRNGTLTIGMGAGQFGSHYKTFDVVNGTAHVVITRAELTEYHNPSESDGRDTVYLDYDALDRSYHTNVGATMIIISEDIDPRDDVQVLITEYNKTLFVGETNTIKGNIGIKTGDGYWTDDGEHYLYYTEPFSDVLITLVIDDKTTTTTTRSDSDGNFELNYDTFNHTAGQVFFNIGIKKEGMFDIKEYFDDSDEESFTLKAYTNITLSAPDITIGETVTITGQVYIPVNGKNASVSSTVKNKRLNITINGGTPISIKITGGKISYQYTPTEMGEFTVTVSWGGTSSYLASSNTTKFRVSPAQTNMTIVNNETILVGQNVEIKGVLKVDNGAVVKNTNVTITVGSKTYENIAVNASGQYYLSCPIDEVGPHVITVTYINHTTGYFSSTNTSSVLVNPRNTNMTIENNESIIVGQEVSINGTVYDELGDTVGPTFVNITVGSTPIYNVQVNENGFFETTCLIDEVGTFVITVNYTSDNVNYTGSINMSEVQVIPRNTNMTIENNETILAGQEVTIKGTLYDEFGVIIPNTFVNITVGENSIENVPVDEYGNYSTTYKINEIGDYLITVIYNNDTTRYYSSTNTSSVKVIPRNTHIVIDDIESVLIGQNVTIKGTLYDELEEVVPNTKITIRIDETYIKEGVVVDENGKFELSYNATSIGLHNVNITYTNETTYYINSTNKSSFTVNPRSTNMTVEFNGPIRVGENLTVYGYLVDELGEKVTNTYVNITVGTEKVENVRVDGNGYYEYNFTLSTLKTYDIVVEYVNDTDWYTSSTNRTEYELTKIHTITNVTVVSDKLYNVTFDVVVCENETDFDSVIKSGTIRVTLNGETKVYELTGSTTRIVLDGDVNITTTDPVSLKVEFVEDGCYIGSTGINSTTGEVITSFTASALNSSVTVEILGQPLIVEKAFNITGQVFDEYGNNVTSGTVDIIVNGDESNPISVPITYNEDRGMYVYLTEYTSMIGGVNNVTVYYNGQKTGQGNVMILPSECNTSVNVDKIPTTTNVQVLNTTYGNATIYVNVTNGTDSSTDLVPVGKVVVSNWYTGMVYAEIILSDLENPGEFNITLPLKDQVNRVKVYYYGTNIYNDSYYAQHISADDPKDYVEIILTPEETNTNIVLLNPESGEVVENVVPGAIINVTGNVSTLTGEGVPVGTVNITVYKYNETTGEYDPLTTINGLVVSGDSDDSEVTGIYQYLFDTRVVDFDTKTLKLKFVANYNGYSYEYNVSCSDDAILTLNKFSTQITVTADSPVKVGKSTIISGKLVDEANKAIVGETVVVEVDGKVVGSAITGENGKYEFKYDTTKVGTFDVMVNFEGNTQYAKNSSTTSFTVEKLDTKLTINKLENVEIGDKIIITGKLLDELDSPVANALINLTVDNQKVTVKTDTSGMFNATVKAEELGVKSIEAVFGGDSKYINSTASGSVEVVTVKASSSVALPDSVRVDAPLNVTGVVSDSKGNPIADLPVNVTVNGKTTETSTDKDGKFNVLADNLVGGRNNVTVSAGNGTVSVKPVSAKVNARKINTIVTVNTTKQGTINEKVVINGKLIDEMKKPVANAVVTVTVDGVSKTVKTDGKGNYKLTYKPTTVGNKSVSAVYAGDDYYASSEAVTSVVVKEPSKITVKSKTVKGGKKVKLEATVKDKNGKLISGGKVVFKVNMKSVVGSDGKAVYVPVKNGKAVLTYAPNNGLCNKVCDLNAVYSGTSRYLESRSNTAKLTVLKRDAKVSFTKKALNAKSFDTVKIKTKVKDKVTGKVVKSGKVTYKLNSVTIGTAKIKNGVSTFKYKLNGKTAAIYKVTAVFSSNLYNRTQKTVNLTVVRTPTKIKVSPIKSKSKTVTVKAQILDNKNKAVKKTTKVSIKINGKTYVSQKKVSNGKINIKVPTDLKKGTYTVTIIAGINGYYQDSRTDTKLTITQ